jgi:hypothetical protein
MSHRKLLTSYITLLEGLSSKKFCVYLSMHIYYLIHYVLVLLPIPGHTTARFACRF